MLRLRFKSIAKASSASVILPIIAVTAALVSCGGGGGGGGGGSTPGTSVSSSATSSSSSSSAPFSGTTVSISAGATGQTVNGWEVTARFWEFNKAGNAYDGSWLTSKDAIVDKLVVDAGITRARIEIRSGVENPVDYWSKFVSGQIGYLEVKSHFYEKINDNADPSSANTAGFQWASFDYYIDNFILPLKSKLASKGKPLYINLCYVDFGWTDLKGTLSHADNASEYAELISLAAKRLRDKYGITTDSVEIILEPDNTDKWTGQNIGRGLLAVKSRLAADGINPKFIAPSPSAASRTVGILDALSSVPNADAALNVVSYHRYDGSLADPALPFIRSRAKTLGAETQMLEYVDASTSNFFRDMEYGGASAFQAYAVAYPAKTAEAVSNGAVLWRADDGTVSLTPQFRQIGLLQREILPGAKARQVTISGSSTDMVISFQNPDGSDVIAIFSPSGGNFQVSGAAKTSYLATYSSRSSAAYPTQTINKGSDGNITVSLTAEQVVLLRSTN
jgi:hypothetical protein